ncbi:MAG: DNA-directed RNA polymerase subunit alpha C-terminal domain-containing protein [Vicinamibacteria bacterium]
MTQRSSPKRALWKSVTELDLAPRPKNALQAAGITTLLDLVRYSRAELLRVKNVGMRDANEIEEKLGEMGLRLGVVPRYKKTRQPRGRRGARDRIERLGS